MTMKAETYVSMYVYICYIYRYQLMLMILILKLNLKLDADEWMWSQWSVDDVRWDEMVLSQQWGVVSKVCVSQCCWLSYFQLSVCFQQFCERKKVWVACVLCTAENRKSDSILEFKISVRKAFVWDLSVVCPCWCNGCSKDEVPQAGMRCSRRSRGISPGELITVITVALAPTRGYSTFSTLPTTLPSHRGRMSLSFVTSSRITPVSNSSLAFLKKYLQNAKNDLVSYCELYTNMYILQR